MNHDFHKIENIHRINPANPENLNKITIRTAKIDFYKAIEISDDYRAYHLLGKIFYIENEYENAVTNYSIAIKKQPDAEYIYLDRGYAKIYIKDYTGALDDFNEYFKYNKDDENLYYWRHYAKYMLQDIQGANDDYDKYVSICNQKIEEHNETTDIISAVAESNNILYKIQQGDRNVIIPAEGTVYKILMQFHRDIVDEYIRQQQS